MTRALWSIYPSNSIYHSISLSLSPLSSPSNPANTSLCRTEQLMCPLVYSLSLPLIFFSPSTFSSYSSSYDCCFSHASYYYLLREKYLWRECTRVCMYIVFFKRGPHAVCVISCLYTVPNISGHCRGGRRYLERQRGWTRQKKRLREKGKRGGGGERGKTGW